MEKTCAELVLEMKNEVMKDIRGILEKNDRQEFLDYILCVDYVEKDTFLDQPEGYWRVQLSWGGPADELRYFVKSEDVVVVEYWYLDWHDGAHIVLADEEKQMALEFYVKCRKANTEPEKRWK